MSTNASGVDVTRELEEFLSLEAELLDDGRYRDWLGLLAPEIRYRVPIRIAKERSAGSGPTGVSTTMFHLDEDLDSLELRIERLETGFAWAEDPPSRLRHFVTNVRVREGEGAEVRVRSNVLIYRARWDRPAADLLSAERHDRLSRGSDGWKLVERNVILDATTLPTLNLTFFF